MTVILRALMSYPFYGVPYNSGGFFTTYEFQRGPLKGLGAGGGVFFSDRVQVTNGDTGSLSGWVQTDLVAFYRRVRFQAQFNVRNLFDNEFYHARNDLNTVQPGAGQDDHRFARNPVLVGMSALATPGW